MFPLAKFITLTPATAARDCICLGHLVRHDRDRIISIFCRFTQGGQGKYSHMSMSLALSPTNVANVNGALYKK